MVYTRRFFAATAPVAASWQTLWTVPTIGTWILRSIVVGNLQSVAGSVLVDVLSADGSKQYLLAGGQLQKESTVIGELRQELLAGEHVRVYAPATGATVLAAGYYFAD